MTGTLARGIDSPRQGSGPVPTGDGVSAARLLAAVGWQRLPAPLVMLSHRGLV